MLTIVTEVQLKEEDAESTWDRVMGERMSAARQQPGWVGGQVARPNDDPRRRVIIGTWHHVVHEIRKAPAGTDVNPAEP